MKTKVYGITMFKFSLIFIVLFICLSLPTSGQENALQGVWVNDDYFTRMTFCSGGVETEIHGEPRIRGEYTISGDEVIVVLTHIHSNSIEGGRRYGWHTKEEAVAEFGRRVDGWFEPVTQTFFINGDILTLISEFSVQQFRRMR
jgi:hypothetical protein